jgi:phage minor structural protein
MLILYNTAHEKLCALPNYSDLHIEQELSSGDSITLDKLHFTYPMEDNACGLIRYECYVRTETAEYVVKESNLQTADNGITAVEFVCDLNVEPLKGTLLDDFEPGSIPASDAARLALAGTGWDVGYCDVTKRRTAAKKQCTVFDVICDIANAYDCEVTFDSLRHLISLHQKQGADRGVYFAEQLNLVQLQIQGNSRDYITRLLPLGKDGMTVASINGGDPFIHNYQYSKKDISAYWIDNRYTLKADLLADAKERLDYLSKPTVAYSADIIDLAKASDGKWSVLDFALGDWITLVSESTGVREQQRIVKLNRYPDEPDKTTVELANRIASLDDIILHVADTADAVDNVTDSTGDVQGSRVAVSNGDGTYSSLNAKTAEIGTLVAQKADIIDLTAANAQIDNLQATAVTTDYLTANYVMADAIQSTYATIDNLEADYLKADSIQSTYATIENLNATNARIDNITAGTVTTDYLEANYAKIDLANIAAGTIKTAMIDTGAVGTAQIADGSITDAKIVNLTADKITAGTLSVERLIITGTDQSIVYTINEANGTAQLSQTTIDGGSLTQRSITADRIVAGAITADEIAAHTITANELAVGTITAESGIIQSIDAGTITTGKISADRIDTTNLQAQKIYSVNLGYYSVIGSASFTGYGGTSQTGSGIVMYDPSGKVGSIVSKKYNTDDGEFESISIQSASGNCNILISDHIGTSIDGADFQINLFGVDHKNNMTRLEMIAGNTGTDPYGGFSAFGPGGSVSIGYSTDTQGHLSLSAGNIDLQGKLTVKDESYDDGSTMRHWHKYPDGTVHQWGRIDVAMSITVGVGSVYRYKDYSFGLQVALVGTATCTMNIYVTGHNAWASGIHIPNGNTIYYDVFSPTSFSNAHTEHYYDIWGRWK